MRLVDVARLNPHICLACAVISHKAVKVPFDELADHIDQNHPFIAQYVMEDEDAEQG